MSVEICSTIITLIICVVSVIVSLTAIRIDNKTSKHLDRIKREMDEERRQR